MITARPRFTVRRLMYLTALVGLGLWVWIRPWELQPVHATSPDPKIAVRQEKYLHGVLWGASYDQAREVALATEKPIFVFFSGVNCVNCRLIERNYLPNPRVASLLSRFVTVRLDTDFAQITSLNSRQREEIAEQSLRLETGLVGEGIAPLLVAVDARGRVLGSMGSRFRTLDYTDFLKQTLAKYKL